MGEGKSFEFGALDGVSAEEGYWRCDVAGLADWAAEKLTFELPKKLPALPWLMA